MRAALLLLVASVSLSGCMTLSPPGASFSSEPPGARVLIDGRDSGWVTPCQIALDHDETQRVTIVLEGYAPRDFVLEPETRRSFVTWPLGVNGVKSTVHFPLLLPWEDLFFPLREVDTLTPGRVFVRLRPEADA